MQTGGLGSETAGFKVTVMTWTIAYLTSWQQLLRRDILKLIQMIKTLFYFLFRFSINQVKAFSDDRSQQKHNYQHNRPWRDCGAGIEGTVSFHLWSAGRGSNRATTPGETTSVCNGSCSFLENIFQNFSRTHWQSGWSARHRSHWTLKSDMHTQRITQMSNTSLHNTSGHLAFVQLTRKLVTRKKPQHTISAFLFLRCVHNMQPI